MTAGGEVVEDYGHVGLTLRAHPVTFLCADLRRQRIVTCAEAMQARDGRARRRQDTTKDSRRRRTSTRFRSPNSKVWC
jgi:DNA polymerase III alpha subunit